MKYQQRLDYGRLAEVLHERGLADLDAIRELLQLSQDGGPPFCESLVTSNLISDWDLSKLVCETFQLPFLPVDLIDPNPAVLEEIDPEVFRKHQLVPIDLFGQVLTVAMPALVPADVLAHIAAMADFVVLPFVGTVESNKRWILDKLAPGPAPAGNWESIFDAGDAGVTGASEDGDAGGLGLFDQADEPAPALPAEGPEGAADALEILSDPTDDDSDALDLGALEALGDTDFVVDGDVDDGTSEDGSELPPMPDFNFGGDSREAG